MSAPAARSQFCFISHNCLFPRIMHKAYFLLRAKCFIKIIFLCSFVQIVCYDCTDFLHDISFFKFNFKFNSIIIWNRNSSDATLINLSLFSLNRGTCCYYLHNNMDLAKLRGILQPLTRVSGTGRAAMEIMWRQTGRFKSKRLMEVVKMGKIWKQEPLK